jgi:hypothetical protein
MGTLGFIWILGAGGWVLYSNFRYGNTKLRRINSVFLSYFLTYSLSFFFIFGAFQSQLFIFLGLVGLNVSLNGGVKRKPKATLAPRALAMAVG